MTEVTIGRDNAFAYQHVYGTLANPFYRIELDDDMPTARSDS